MEVATSQGLDMATARIGVDDYFHQIRLERGMYSGSRSDIGQKLDALYLPEEERSS